ncbi:MAG: LysR family transcriptional regulator [Deltaproteobacteria bacterium]|nr:LysR family transcriptional regulator [Deltaproteobacteria bacterium]
MLNFNQLRAFHQVAKTLNFTIASENLFVSQPAVTAHIKLFEEFCELRLFKKTGRKIYLTDEGKTIFTYTTRIFEMEENLERTIYDLKKIKQGCLRIGTTKTYARYLMPVLLTPFHKSFPGIRIELNEGSSLEMSNSLLDFRSSLAIIPKVDDNPNIDHIPLFREEIAFICSSDNHLINRDKISFEELLDEPIVMKEIGSGTRKLIEEYFGNKKEKLNIIAETSNMEFIKELVKQGEGVSFLVRSNIKRELAERTLVTIPIKDRSLFLDVCIAYLHDYNLPLAAETFLNFLRPIFQLNGLPRSLDVFLAKIPIEK